MSKQAKYIGIFKEEAAEHLENLSLGLLELELKPDNPELIHELLRAAHTLKGSAKMLGLENIGEVGHIMEDVFKAIEESKVKIEPEVIDALLNGTDIIKEIIDKVGQGEQNPPDIAPVLEKLKGALASEEAAPAPKKSKKAAHEKTEKEPEHRQEKKPEPKAAPKVEPKAEPKAEMESEDEDEDGKKEEKPKAPEQDQSRMFARQERDTIRVDTKKLDELLTVAGELLINKIKIESHLHKVASIFDKLEKERANIGGNGLDSKQAAKLLTKLLEDTSDGMREIFQTFSDSVVDLDLFSQEIRNQAMGLRVLPAKVLFDEFYRTVRDFSRELKKEIKLVVSGGDTELDKQLIEELRPALMHMIRNCCDHGIEKPEERVAAGKPAEGSVIINAYHKGHNVIVEVSDDGAGIDVDRVKKVAVDKGIMSQATADEMTDDEALYIVLRPGFSTARIITDISGRGVGMDVVKTNIERIKGDIMIESERGKYTRFTLTAPLTLSIMSSLLIQARKDIFAVPLTYVQETVRLPVDAIFTEAGKDVFNLRGEVIPLVRLDKMLNYESKMGAETFADKLPVIVLKFRNQRLGLMVDNYLRDQEIVVKSLGKFLGDVPFVGGVTVLRYGEPAIILNVFDIFAAAEKWSDTGILEQYEKAKVEQVVLKLLVVDDSITTRMMEKSILEAAGYNVDLAISGEEAEEKLAVNEYDLVVSDVEMPGISGFELTRRIRQSEKTKDLPVVIVTSLSSDEHKRKGIEVGAQAYIVKGTFDQTTLLDTVKSLIS